MNSITLNTINPPAVITQDIQDRLARLMQKPAVEIWSPEPGEQLGGIIHGGRQETNPYGQLQDQALIQTPDGRIVAVWLSAWMLGQLRAKAADVGDLIVLSYLGKGRSQRGSEYNQYSIEIEKAAA
jgi:hypothetical protein